MAQSINFEKFKNLTYDHYREMAKDPALSEFEKVGFPDSYREGKGGAIFADICSKLPALADRGLTILEIGPGCSEPAKLMVAHCREQGHRLIVIDAPEMLDLLPDEPHLVKMPGRYPTECQALFDEYTGKIDVVVAYGVVPVIFAEGLLFPFLDATLTLLADGGRWLIGDIANQSKRKRFFASETGAAFHRKFMNTDDAPKVEFNVPEIGHMDDSVIMAMMMRCRSAGYDAYVLPQPADLPMANRREDMLIVKP